MRSLDRQVAIITGGASGIGRGIARVLIDEGARLPPLGRARGRGRRDHGQRGLASPEARYVTGQTLVIDGGQVLPESA